MYSFGRSIAGTGADTAEGQGQDFDLDGIYYVLFGHSNGNRASGSLLSHVAGGSNPSISEQFNIARDSGVGSARAFEGIKRALIRAHGVLMLVAWFFFANCGIAFAGYMRLPLPNGEWFQVHRAFMITSLFLAAAGFVLIFVSQLRSIPAGLIDLSTVS